MPINYKRLNGTLADAVMDRPREFFIGKKRFCLWSPSLGMSLMLECHLSELGIDRLVLSKNPAIEMMRLTVTKRYDVCYVLAIFTFRKYSELSCAKKIKQRARFFESNLSEEEIVQLLMISLSEPKAETLIALSGIAKDQEEQSKIAKHKNREGHTFSFGGKTIYGTLIDAACRKYGWTKQYVVWGIDLVSLRMMLADSVNSVYLSDDDMKSLGIGSSENGVFGMSAEDFAQLRAMTSQ